MEADEGVDALKHVLSSEMHGIIDESKSKAHTASSNEEIAHEDASHLRRHAQDAVDAEVRQKERRVEAEMKLREALDAMRHSRNAVEEASHGPTGAARERAAAAA